MRFKLFPQREEDVYNFIRLLVVIFILAVLPLSIILTQRQTRLRYEAKEETGRAVRPLTGVRLEDVETKYLYPTASGVGWVKSNDTVVAHLGDDDIHAGFWEKDEYIGLLQFDLASLPEGAKISGVQLSLIGKSDSRLGEGGEWRFEILKAAVDKDFSRMNFTDFESAQAEISLYPIIKRGDLKVTQETSFTFSEEEVALVRERFGTTKMITFRIVGPSPDRGFLGEKQEFDLFTWESGYGEGTFKIKPVMEILYTQ